MQAQQVEHHVHEWPHPNICIAFLVCLCQAISKKTLGSTKPVTASSHAQLRSITRSSSRDVRIRVPTGFCSLS